jgi:hypothetical protein
MLRKYWFMVFLLAMLVMCLIALVEPSWEREIRTQVSIGFAVVILWFFIDRLDRIESKLDAILKKLDAAGVSSFGSTAPR